MKVKGDLRFGSTAAAGQAKDFFVEQQMELAGLESVEVEAGRLYYVLDQQRFAYDDGVTIQVIPNMSDLGGSGATEGIYTFNSLTPKDIVSGVNLFHLDIPATVINGFVDDNAPGGIGTYNRLDALSFKLTAVIDMFSGDGSGGPSSSLSVDYVDGKARILTNFTYGDDGAAITFPYDPVTLPTSSRVLILNDVEYLQVDDGDGGLMFVLRLSFLVKAPEGFSVPDDCTLKGTMTFSSHGYNAS